MESELMKKVINFANEDTRISSVVLRGSRTNPNATVDEDSDYDVMIGVNDLPSFQVNDEWLAMFGDILILQKPESMLSTLASTKDFKEMYLMQFRDGTRLDLAVVKEEYVQDEITKDSLSKIILDKTGQLSADEPNENSYINDRLNLSDCVNEFLWLSFYVLKGCKRKRVMYTHNHLNMMREEFLNLLTIQHGGNPGAHFKNAEKFLNAYELNIFKDTFNQNIYNSVKVLFELFETHLKKETYDFTQFNEIRYKIESGLQNCNM